LLCFFLEPVWTFKFYYVFYIVYDNYEDGLRSYLRRRETPIAEVRKTLRHVKGSYEPLSE